jgi:hypothetical protein
MVWRSSICTIQRGLALLALMQGGGFPARGLAALDCCDPA